MKVHNLPIEASARDCKVGHILELPGFVYFLQSDERELVKIGFSRKLADRLNMLRSEYRSQLTYLGHLAGSLQTEARFHRQFADERLTGEWFEPSRRLRQFICELRLDRVRPLFYDLFTSVAQQPFCDLFEARSMARVSRLVEVPYGIRMAIYKLGRVRSIESLLQAPTKKAALKKRPRGNIFNHAETLKKGEVERLLSVIKSRRDRAMFYLACCRGLRAQEVALLQLSDFSQRAGTLNIVGNQGAVCRPHFLTEVEILYVCSWINERGIEPGPLFGARQRSSGISASRLHRLMKEYCKLARIQVHAEQMDQSADPSEIHCSDLRAAADEIRHWLGSSWASGSKRFFGNHLIAQRAEFADRLRNWC